MTPATFQQNYPTLTTRVEHVEFVLERFDKPVEFPAPTAEQAAVLRRLLPPVQTPLTSTRTDVRIQGDRRTEEKSMPPTPPLSTTEALAGAIEVLTECRDRIIAMKAPVVQPDLMRAVELSREIMRIRAPERQ